RTIGISLRVLGLVEGGPVGEQLLREAVDVLEASPARLEHARALIDLGAALRRRNNRSEARQLLRQGIELAHTYGGNALVERALAQADELAVLSARGGELEGEFAFAIVRQLFEAPLAAATSELRAELLSGAAGLSASLFASAPSPSDDGA